MTTYKMLIDGDWVASSTGQTFPSLNPATGEAWAEIPEASAEDVDRAVRAAYRACYEGPWSQMTATARGHCLRRLADLLAERSEALGETETSSGRFGWAELATASPAASRNASAISAADVSGRKRLKKLLM